MFVAIRVRSRDNGAITLSGFLAAEVDPEGADARGRAAVLLLLAMLRTLLGEGLAGVPAAGS